MSNKAIINISSNLTRCLTSLTATARDARQDLKWIVLLGVYLHGNITIQSARDLALEENICQTLYIISITFALFILFFYSFRYSRSKLSRETTVRDCQPEEPFTKSRLFPSKTTHVRFFPKRHSFAYSYLLVSVPVGWHGSIGRLLGVDLHVLPKGDTRRRWTWFSVDSTDYLNRGTHPQGLRGKLESFLRSQHEDPGDYPYVYFVTAPRFLGYAFNPVSFWYLYDANRALRAMVLEVNNTTDERHLYFLKGSTKVTAESDPDDTKQEIMNVADACEAPQTNDNDCNGDKVKFTDAWAKDFHVSPFSSRKGAYSLSAQDPLAQGRINTTITLSSSKGHPKLVARIFSTDDSVDPSRLGIIRILRFIASWWWVGFVTFPRIIREAMKLFLRRNLHVWYRPEVVPTSIGRQETESERAIEKCFRAFLKSTVEQSNLQAPVDYTAAMSSVPETFYPQHLQGSQNLAVECSNAKALNFKVSTPAFYSSIARQSHIFEFVTNSLLLLPSNAHTFHVSDFQGFLKLLEGCRESLRHKQCQASLPIFDSLRWHIVQWLRTLYPKSHGIRCPPADTCRTISDIRPFSFSMLDEYAQQSSDTAMAIAYRRATAKLLLSDIVALGQPGLIDAIDWLIRMVLCGSFVQSLGKALSPLMVPNNRLPDEGFAITYPLWKPLLDLCWIYLWWAFKALL